VVLREQNHDQVPLWPFWRLVTGITFTQCNKSSQAQGALEVQMCHL